jgi:hypothetical protein
MDGTARERTPIIIKSSGNSSTQFANRRRNPNGRTSSPGRGTGEKISESNIWRKFKLKGKVTMKIMSHIQR